MRVLLVAIFAAMILPLTASPAMANHCQTQRINYEKLAGDEYYCERHGFLGPVGWWWNTVWYNFMRTNTVAMVFIGIEIFVFPFFVIGWLLFMLFVGAWSLLGRFSTT